MASLYKKVISGRPYWYLREMGWVDGRPKMVSERYLGTAAEIEALLDAREQQVLPGAVAGTWTSGRWPRCGGCWPIWTWPRSSTRRSGPGRPGWRCLRVPT